MVLLLQILYPHVPIEAVVSLGKPHGMTNDIIFSTTT
jgi:hypothetical protein